MKDNDRRRKPAVHDLNVYLREGFYLPENRQEHKFKNKTGYTLTDQTDLNDFVTELKSDFESHILPYLDRINSLQDCINSFGDITFWGDNLKRVIEKNKLLSQ